MIKKGNIYAATANHSPEEIFETLIDSGKVRIERILSYSSRSPDGFWYDQEEAEWVLVISGSAGLKFEGEEDILVLRPGDWVEIGAHVRHRVEWTDPGEKTVWLAVFYR
ncbi:MAG: cupin domain-containing protein [Syntrophobacteraceae bacterium]|nr:cupin domain-containing protein [Syntrophobacteraceae bacterium]